VNGVLIVVSRTKPGQYTYLKHAFEREAIDVILDRRAEERRRRQESAPVQRRRRDRRQRDISEDLETFGWAVVRR
jgi:DNA-binding NtrC family response regulator